MNEVRQGGGDATEAAPDRRARWLVLLGVWLAYVSFGLVSVSLAPLVGPVTRDLDLSHSAMGAILGSWQAVYIAAAVPCGTLLDRLGARTAIFAGVLLIALSALLRGLAVDFWSLCLAVGLFGVGGPLVSAGAPKVVSIWFHGRDRGLAMGLYMTGPSIGAIAGLSLTNAVLMPLLGDDWRLVLQVWSVAAAAGAVAWFILAAPPAPPVAPPPRAGGETRPQGAIILGLLRLPAVRILLAISVCIFAFNHALNNWLPEVLRGHGMTPAAAGYWATIPTVVGIAGSLLVPRLATPPRRGAILLALALCATASTVLLQSDAGTLLAAGLVAQGIARSALMTIALLALVETRGVGERYAGTAGGLFFSAAEVGGAGGPILFGVLHDATGGYAASLAMLTGLTILMLLCLARLRAVSTAPDPA